MRRLRLLSWRSFDVDSDIMIETFCSCAYSVFLEQSSRIQGARWQISIVANLEGKDCCFEDSSERYVCLFYVNAENTDSLCFHDDAVNSGRCSFVVYENIYDLLTKCVFS